MSTWMFGLFSYPLMLGITLVFGCPLVVHSPLKPLISFPHMLSWLSRNALVIFGRCLQWWLMLNHLNVIKVFILFFFSTRIYYYLVAKWYPTLLWHHGWREEPARLLCPWGFSRQEYWSGLPFPSSGDFPDPGINPMSLASPALASGFFTTESQEFREGQNLDTNVLILDRFHFALSIHVLVAHWDNF